MTAKSLIITATLFFVVFVSAASAIKPEGEAISTLEEGLGPVVTASLI